MRRICLYVCLAVSLVFLVNATIWEGAAATAGGGELPENGLSIATNAFPVNTPVEVTNLENGKSVRVMTTSPLDAPGLLAILSREAANAIELQSRTLGRIRMTQGEDPAVFRRSGSEFSSSGDPDYDPAVFVAMNGYSVPLDSIVDESARPGTERIEGGELIVDLPEFSEDFIEEYIPPEYFIPPWEEVLAEEEEAEEDLLIVDLPEYIPEPIEEPVEIAQEPVPEIIEEPVVIAEEPVPEPIEEPIEESIEIAEEPEEELLIVDLPEYIPEPIEEPVEIAEEPIPEPIEEPVVIAEEPVPESIEEPIEEPIVIAEEPVPEPIKEPIHEPFEIPMAIVEEPIPETFELPVEIAEEPIPETFVVPIEVAEELVPEMFELPVEIAEEPIPEPDFDLILVPAEARPPEVSVEIDESLIINGIDHEPPVEIVEVTEPLPFVEVAVEPIVEPVIEPVVEEPASVLVSVVPITPEPVYVPAPVAETPVETPRPAPVETPVEIPRPAPVVEAPRPAPVEPPVEIPRPAPVVETPRPAPVVEVPVEIPRPAPIEAPRPAPVETPRPAPQEPPVLVQPPREIFSAPLISSLEKGKYYLQVAAYSKAETVESELAKIDQWLPKAVMNAGTDENPVYRILVGPVNLGESGALLQRLKITYKDAFVRQGS